MAHLETRNGWYRIVFSLKGERFSKSLNTQSERSAKASLAKVEDNLHRFELGLIEVPSDREPISFFLGQDAKKHTRQTVKTEIKSVGIKRAWKIFQDALPEGALEQNAISGMKTHVDHLARIIGTFKLNQIDKPTLQKYIDKRSKEAGRYGRTVSVQTIKKELRTFSTIWNWMIEEKLVSHAFPSKKLRYPKFHEKPPFQTWKQIETRIKRGGLNECQVKELWDSLFLDIAQVRNALTHAKTNARQNVIYPMLCFAAYTGARRSEIMRSELDDLDFTSSVITIREKKRVRGKLSTRTVPMQTTLKKVLRTWLNEHPG